MSQTAIVEHQMHTDTLVHLLRDLHLSVCVIGHEGLDDPKAKRYISTLGMVYQCATGMKLDADELAYIFILPPSKEEYEDARGT